MSDPDRPHPHAAFLEGLRHARRFQDRPVPPAIIDDLLAAGHGQDDPATLAWQFLVVDDRETRQALSRIGAFTSTLADAAVAIVIVSAARSAPSKANEEARAGDRIMLAASRHGLGSGMGWFGTEEAQERVRDILGVPPGRTVWGAVGVGYVDEAPVAGDSALDRARRTLDQLAGPPASGRKPPAPADEQE
jgi:nitroreductase